MERPQLCPPACLDHGRSDGRARAGRAEPRCKCKPLRSWPPNHFPRRPRPPPMRTPASSTRSHSAPSSFRSRRAGPDRDVSLVGLRASAAATQAKAEALAAHHARELVSIEGRLRVLSEPKGEERAGALSRGTTGARGASPTDATCCSGSWRARRPRRLGAASETYTRVSDQRRTDFDAKLLARTASPLEAGFWTGLAAAVEPDSRRVTALAAEAWRSALAAAEPRAASAVLISLIVAALVAWPLRRFLLRSVQRRDTVENTPRQELRRSAHALTIVLINTALPALAAACVNLGLTWGDVPLRPGAGARAGAYDRGHLGRGRARPRPTAGGRRRARRRPRAGAQTPCATHARPTLAGGDDHRRRLPAQPVEQRGGRESGCDDRLQLCRVPRLRRGREPCPGRPGRRSRGRSGRTAPVRGGARCCRWD